LLAFRVVYDAISVVPHDHPIRSSLGMLRRFRMKSTTAETSLTAVSLRTMGGCASGFSAISFGRVE
jgi:hypothetical protein